MKAATPELITLLATVRQYHFEDVATFELSDGNFSVTTNRGNAAANTPIFKRGGVRTQIGAEVSQITVDLLCNANTLVMNLPALTFAYNGGFDGANMTCVRYFRANAAANIAGNQMIFAGRVSDLDVDAGGIHMTVMSEMELLNMQLPRNMFQAGCLHDVYDADCGVVVGSFEQTGHVSANTSTLYQLTSNLSVPTDKYALGTMVMTSGAMNGLTRTVKSSTSNGTIVPVLPFPSVPQFGDTFTIKPGCDKTFNTCVTVFNNANNFRGYEFIPTPETSY